MAMILAAQQPGYLPDLSFFFKMICSDVFLLADDLQYSTRSNINRTRIKTASGVRWLTVPVLSKGRGGQRISEVEIDPFHEWRRRHLRTTEVTYAATPFYDRYCDTLAEYFHRPWTHLAELNIALIVYAERELRIPTLVRRTSEFRTPQGRTEKVLDLLETMQCDTYLTWPHERGLLDEGVLQQAGRSLQTMEFRHPTYHQRFGSFRPGLSVLDLLMNEGEEAAEILRESRI